MIRKCSLNEGVVLSVPTPSGNVLCRVVIAEVGSHPKIMIDAPRSVEIVPVSTKYTKKKVASGIAEQKLG